MEYGYIVVEGPQDVEFIARLLKSFQFSRIQAQSRLDPFWGRLVPTSFPINDDLLRRVPVPLFLQNQTHSVAIHSAIGDTRLIDAVEETVVLIDQSQLGSIGLVLDADKAVVPSERFATIKEGLSQIGLPTPNNPGEVTHTSPRVGAFVLPDNQTQGTLEDILLECATIVYPSLLVGAQNYVDNIDMEHEAFTQGDKGDFYKPAGRRKAIVSCITSVLKPGRAMQVSIQDNRWLDQAALTLPRITAILSFLQQLLNLP